MFCKRTASAGIGLLLATTVTACGAVSDLIPQENDFAEDSAKEIFAAAKKDLASLQAVHVSGSGRSDGQGITVNMTIGRSGDCRGTLRIQGVGRLELLVAQSRTFIRPDEAFLRHFGLPPAQARLTAALDRWLEGGEDITDEVCDLEQLFDMSGKGFKSLRKALPGKVTVGGATELMGIETVLLTSKHGNSSYSMSVAVDEPHHVVEMHSLGTKNSDGSFIFSEHDVPLETTVPDASDIVKMPGLE